MIEQYGWSDLLARAFAPHARAGHIPGRVVVQQRDGYLVATDEGELRAKAAGRLHHEADETGPPVVGDWVALSLNPAEGAATVHAILPRRTAFVRRGADSLRRLQVIAANIDVAFIVTSLNADLNPRRIERYLAAAWQSGARPVVVLTKSDLSDDPQGQAAEIAALAVGCPVLVVAARQGLGLDGLRAQMAPGETSVLTKSDLSDDPQGQAAEIAALAVGCPVLVVSARQGLGLDDLRAHLTLGETSVLIGSSGVGKSTLVNALLGEDRMATQAIRESDDEGRHTTSHRQLVLLPGGGLILDTPGIREVGLIDADEGVSAVFDDIERLAQDCKFNDCSHAHEPGCAIRAALESGALDPARWAHFQKLGAELAAAEGKAERAAKEAERRRGAALQKQYRSTKRNDRGGAD